MFKQSKVVYIISEENEGNAKAIIEELIEYNILYYFYDEENIPFYNFISSLPKNTVFCINLSFDQENISSSKIANIALPFISSHVNFPVKVGETIWFYPYDISEQNISSPNSYSVDGYYLGRVHSLLNTEDTSYCFSEREQTVYNIDEKSIDDVIKEGKEGKGILEELSMNELYKSENTETNILQKCDEKVNAVISKEILNSDYYVKTLKNYSLKPSIEVSSKTEDFIARGTYGNTIQLTSAEENDEEIEDKKRNLPFKTRKGKINLIVGEKERLKNSSLVESTKTKTKDNEDFIDEDGVIFNKYNNNFLPEFHNGVFTETIKSSKLFNNKFRIDQECLESFDAKPLNNILNNISTFTISEKSIDYDIVKNKINFKIPQVDSMFFTKENNNSNLYDLNKKFNTVIPKVSSIPVSDIKIKYENQSSIVGVSDNIIFSVPETGAGDIILSTPNGPDKLSNYLKITNDGNFHVDSHKIVIGRLERLPSKDGLYGNGSNAGLFLGFSNEMQSLVLGEQLKEFIEEIVIIQKQSISLIKDLFIQSKIIDEKSKEALEQISSTLTVLKNSLDVASQTFPLTPLSAVSQSLNLSIDSDLKEKINKIKISEYASKINGFLASGNINDKNKPSEELFSRLETVENSLYKILSKFVKSS